MRIGFGLAVVLALVVVLAFGLAGTSAAPAVMPSGDAIVGSGGKAGSSGRGALDDADDERLQSLVGSSAFTQLAE